MVDWGWLVSAFLCGVIVTMFSIKKIFIWVALRRPDWAVSQAKILYETAVEYRIKIREYKEGKDDKHKS